MKKTQTLNRLIARSPLAAAVAIGLFAAPMAQAFDFGEGDLKGSLDTTVSYGISGRLDDPSEGLIGKATLNPLIALQGQVLPGLPSSISTHPGSAAQIAAPGRFSGNRDDGNIKYEKGDLFSNAFKITADLEVTYKDWGLFTRASYFYDFENNGRDDMTQAALEKVGSDFRLYDAFIFKNYTLGEGGVSGSVRVGQQVINWGESTFIQGGINGANPIDVSRLRVAGAELKEAYLPVGMVWGSMQFNEAWSVEGYYQYEWTPTEIDPSGTYFSTNDFASPGGTYVMLGFGTVTQPVWNPENYASTCIIGKPASGQTNVGNSDRFAELSAQYGAATATALLAAACSAAGPRLEPDREARDSGQFGVALRYYAEALNQTEFGFYAMNYHSRLPLLSGRAANVILPTPASNSAALIVEYPEDIHLFGVSFNTTLPGGVAWQGELSYRPNAPFQVDDVEVLFAGLSPINLALGASGAPPAVKFCSQLLPNCAAASPGQYIKGWTENQMTQLQMTFTKAFGQVLGAEQIALVGEIGGTNVDLPDQSVLRYEGEGTDTGGGCSIADVYPQATYPSTLFTQPGCARNPQTQADGFPTDFSWGYRVGARADYNSAFGTPITLSPRIAFNHDVNGITPGPGGNFLEGRKSITLGLEANYLNSWVFDLSYTGFSGAGELNQIYDRDFYSFSAKYSF